MIIELRDDRASELLVGESLAFLAKLVQAGWLQSVKFNWDGHYTLEYEIKVSRPQEVKP